MDSETQLWQPIVLNWLVLNPQIVAGFKRNLTTCAAFWDERLEAYNPIGIQYLFENVHTKEVSELELHLNWYDSHTEFNELLEIVHRKAEPNMTNERIAISVNEIIKEVGAFPNRSIITTYLDTPRLERMPDYIVATTIEEVLSD